MKRFLTATLASAVVLAAAPSTAATPDRIFEIASILQGRFEGSTPGNELLLQMSTVTIDPSHPFDVFVQVDGGVSAENAAEIREAGADLLVAGSAIFWQDDPAAAYVGLTEKVAEAVA